MEEQNTIEQEVVEQPQAVEETQPQEQPVEAPVEQTEPTPAPFKLYDSAEEMLASQQPQPQAEPTPEPSFEPEPSVDAQAAPTQPEPRAPQYSNEEVDAAITQYLSERLGRAISSFDDLVAPEVQIDERVQAISKFVSETGRSPQDWFTYQSFDTSNMDDVTAVRVKMATDHPNLTAQEINLLLSKKYSMDPESNTEEEIQLANLQLKMDGAEAKKSIEIMRESYKAPELQEQPEIEDWIDEEWINNMVRETSSLRALEFDLAGDKTFNFALSDDYKKDLISRNTRLDEFFDPYVDANGKWDYDLLSSHRAVIDNIDSIVKSAYQQGMSDGQRNVVNRAANVQAVAPQEQTVSGEPERVKALRNIMNENKTLMTFNA